MRDAPQVDGFEVEHALGAGGFGEVWVARARGSGRRCALKVARASDAATRARFAQEAAALRRVGAPWAPALYAELETACGRPALAMELVAERTLADVLEELRAPLPAARVGVLLDPVLAALAAAHARGVIHRDLKPEHIALCGARAALMDFGLALDAAAPADDRLTPSGLAVGTVEYMAPEQLTRGEVDGRADLYAVGVIVYELLTLRLPFDGDTGSLRRAHVALRPRLPSAVAEVGAALERLVLRCLAKDPGDRPATADELRDELRAACADVSTARTVRAPRAQPGRAAEPVVLVAVRGARAAEVTATARRHGGVLARQRGDRYLLAFVGDRAADPMAAAERAARELAGPRSAVAVDLAQATVVRQRGQIAVYGPNVRMPALPEAGELAQLPATRSAGGGGELIGRGRELAALRASATGALASGRPGLATIAAAPRAGVTRLLDELACALDGDAQIVRVRCEAPATGIDALGARDLRALARRRPVAVLVDDAQWADDALLDALEHAALDGDGVALWIATAWRAEPGPRPRWGARAERHDRVELGALADTDARALAAALLRPAEFPPAALLDQLGAWTGGIPGDLVDVVDALVRDGAVRQTAAGGWYVATAAVDGAATSPARDWLAARALRELPDELAALARAAAVLGPRVDAPQLAALIDAAERRGVPVTPMDARVGLRELAAAGIVREHAGIYAFTDGRTHDAIHRTLDDQTRQQLHACAARLGPSLEQRPWHAEQCGELALAASAYVDLAEREPRPTASDRYAARAIALADSARARIAAGRARYRLDRVDEAIADLTAAAALAPDDATRATALLELATGLDWADDYEASAHAAGRAIALLPPCDPRAALARGRAHLRAQRLPDALAELDAAARGDGETGTLALLLRAPTLVLLDRVDDARADYDALLARCERDGDRFHLCAAHVSRLLLWEAVGDDARADADLARAIELAREIGHPLLECQATCNLGELRLWAGDDDAAVRLARRACDLQARFRGRPLSFEALLLARALAARGGRDDRAEAAAVVARLRAGSAAWTPIERALLRAVELVLHAPADADAWAELLAVDLPREEALELVYWRARAARATGDAAALAAALTAAREGLAVRPIWRARFSALQAVGVDPAVDLPAIAGEPAGERPHVAA